MPKFQNNSKKLDVETVQGGVSFTIEHTNQSDFPKQILIPHEEIPALVRYLQSTAAAGHWIPVYDTHPPRLAVET